MARTQAISLLQAAAGAKAELAEIYGIVIDAVRKDTLSETLKNTQYNGDPATGSVEYKRFANAKPKAYGTARAAGKGDAIVAAPVTVNLDQHQEIVEEANKFDLDTLGVSDIMGRRAANHVDTLVSDLDTAFFAAADTAATVVTATGTALERLEALISTLESVKNDYVQGVPRNQMAVVCSTGFYGQLRTQLDVPPRSNVDTAAEEFGIYHGVRNYSSIYLPDGVDAIAMLVGAVGLPVVTYPYSEPEKIPLSKDYGIALFYDYGVQALTPDLLFKLATPTP